MGQDERLSAIYAGKPDFDLDEFRTVAESAFQRFEPLVIDYLASAPQTNEVGRSAPVMAGLLEIAHRHDLPFDLYEIGASAGLNLVPDLHGYRFGNAVCGNSTALVLAPTWSGPLPPMDVKVRVASRSGVDRSPVDLQSTEATERLLSYVWPDQPDRRRRLTIALRTALQAGIVVERADAGDWVASHFATPGGPGTVKVLFHTVVWSYLAPATQARIEDTLRQAGAQATPAAPLAWLRYELDPEHGACLRLTLWPSGEEHVLARGHPHGTSITYLGLN
jgi:hypothetical protein